MSELKENMNLSLKELAEFKGYDECGIVLFDDNLRITVSLIRTIIDSQL